MKIETLAVHGGYAPDPTTKAVAVPVYQTTSYAFDSTQQLEVPLEKVVGKKVQSPPTAQSPVFGQE